MAKKKIDWVKKDEEARKKYIVETGKEITYGKFRQFHPELVPSINEKSLDTKACEKSIASHCRNVREIYQHLTDADEKIIKNDYCSGASLKKIANKFKVSSYFIKQRLLEMGVYEEKTKNKWEKSDIEILTEMHLSGFTNKAIATVLNRTPKAIAEKKKEIGLKNNS